MSLDIYLELDCCEHCGRSDEGYWSNITHNLGTMAANAGFYEQLWHPERNGIKTANDLINPLREGIAKLESNPAFFNTFNASNGWGTYDQFLPWLIDLLDACEESPNAHIRVSI